MMLIPEVAKQHEEFAFTLSVLEYSQAVMLFFDCMYGARLVRTSLSTSMKLCQNCIIPLYDENNQFNMCNYVFLTLLSFLLGRMMSSWRGSSTCGF